MRSEKRIPAGSAEHAHRALCIKTVYYTQEEKEMYGKMDHSKLFHHCTRVECRDGIYYPQRFSEELLQFYASIDEGKEIRARSAAGITMECITDAEEIRFCYVTKGFCRDFVAFDIFENDIFMQTMTEPNRSPEGCVRYRKRTAGAVKLTVFLPQCVALGISQIHMGKWQPSEDPAEKILFLGDSITQGMVVSSPSQAFPVLLSRFLRCDYLNTGVGGYVFDKASLQGLRDIRADKIVIAYGTNDYHMVNIGKLTLEQFRQNVEAYLDEVIRMFPQGEILVLTPIWRGDCTEQSWKLFVHMGTLIRECALARNLEVVDGLTIIGHDERLYVDGIHPGDWGANMMALNILHALEEKGSGIIRHDGEKKHQSVAQPEIDS